MGALIKAAFKILGKIFSKAPKKVPKTLPKPKVKPKPKPKTNKKKPAEKAKKTEEKFDKNTKGCTQGCAPDKAKQVLKDIEKNNGTAPKGYKGGKKFENDGRAGGEVLPKTDAKGNPIKYKEYDVNPYQKGINRGAERVVRGSDGKAYYTSDHYGTFTPMN